MKGFYIYYLPGDEDIKNIKKIQSARDFLFLYKNCVKCKAKKFLQTNMIETKNNKINNEKKKEEI